MKAYLDLSMLGDAEVDWTCRSPRGQERMKMARVFNRSVLIVFASLVTVGVLLGDEGDQADWPQTLLESTGIQGGLVVHLGCGDGRLTAKLRADDRYVVQGLDVDPARVAQARNYLRSLAIYGDVSVEWFDGKRLPYADNLVNLLVAEDLGELPMVEVMRVLAPRGVVCVKSNGKWEQKTKPCPQQIDEWTHWLHGADGNAVSNDTVVGPPRHVQWIAEPTWQRHHEMSPSVEAMVSASGRVFAIINEAPPGVDGLPDRWKLVARDAFITGNCCGSAPSPSGAGNTGATIPTGTGVGTIRPISRVESWLSVNEFTRHWVSTPRSRLSTPPRDERSRPMPEPS